MESTQKTYSIGDTSRITGVTKRSLRGWEGLHIPFPERIVCGERAYRRYSPVQVRLISRIKEYLEHGYTLKKASEMAREECKVRLN